MLIEWVVSVRLAVKVVSCPAISTTVAEGAVPFQPSAVAGSTAFVPAVAGLLIAGEIVKDLCGNGRIGA